MLFPFLPLTAIAKHFIIDSISAGKKMTVFSYFLCYHSTTFEVVHQDYERVELMDLTQVVISVGRDGSMSPMLGDCWPGSANSPPPHPKKQMKQEFMHLLQTHWRSVMRIYIVLSHMTTIIWGVLWNVKWNCIGDNLTFNIDRGSFTKGFQKLGFKLK